MKFMFVSHERSTHRVPEDKSLCPNCDCSIRVTSTNCEFCSDLLCQEVFLSIRNKKLTKFVQDIRGNDSSYMLGIKDVEMDCNDDY